jgi:hypothetical protein
MLDKPTSVSSTLDSRVDSAEQLYFSMFPSENADKFRRFLLYVVYFTVCENNGITLNKIQWKLDNDFALKNADVEIAVNALSNPRIFNAISKFHLKRVDNDACKQVVHLRQRKRNKDLINAWCDRVLKEFPEYAKMDYGL